jgi:hypothetical protein
MGSFFDKGKIDGNRASEIASDLQSLADSVESHRAELDTYRDTLESLKSDIEDAETKDDLDRAIEKLRDVSVPEGYEDCDGSPDGIADECEECRDEADRSDYDEWQEDISQRLAGVRSILAGIGRGALLPSQKEHPWVHDDSGLPRIVRPGGGISTSCNLPYTSEKDAWQKALNSLADRSTALEPATGDGGAAAASRDLARRLMCVVIEMMSYRGADGERRLPEETPMLALMWFVDDLLHAVAKNLGWHEGRVVVTGAFAVKRAIVCADATQSEFGKGCEQIDAANQSRA